ncbi:MAG: hypothetical protein ACRCW4_13405 [Candidatus Neomicrothrix subdominans]
MPDRTCSVDGCAKPVKTKGLCDAHYKRQWRYGDPLAGATTRGAAPAFIEMAVASQTDECIIWPYSLTAAGYGRLRINGRVEHATRVVLTRTVGPAPTPGMEAAHAPDICHNPPCINPRHLRWATRAENDADRLIDGTSNRGEQHGLARLTSDQVLAIRADPRQYKVLAAEYGISWRTVGAIKERRAWRWLH